jgi:hypothetical protein
MAYKFIIDIKMPPKRFLLFLRIAANNLQNKFQQNIKTILFTSKHDHVYNKTMAKSTHLNGYFLPFHCTINRFIVNLNGGNAANINKILGRNTNRSPNLSNRNISASLKRNQTNFVYCTHNLTFKTYRCNTKIQSLNLRQCKHCNHNEKRSFEKKKKYL